MKSVPFTKLSGAGNDFIAINNWAGTFTPRPSLTAWTRAVCNRFRYIGADGLLLLERSKKADVKMRIINADGSEAEMCGNGVRCLAKFALMKKVVKHSRMTVETLSGIKAVEVKGATATVDMGAPRHEDFGVTLIVKSKKLEGHFVDTGVPHAIIFTSPSKLQNGDVETLGRAVRLHDRFKPKGTNVDFVWIESAHLIHARVYERGVEGETLACGTGACASAYVAVKQKKVKWPVDVVTSGGERLHINQSSEGHLIMSGPVRVIFEGTL